MTKKLIAISTIVAIPVTFALAIFLIAFRYRDELLVLRPPYGDDPW